MTSDQTFIAVVLGWVIAVLVASIIFRLTRSKAIFKPGLSHAMFAENWRSGRSLQNFVTRIGGANNCLWVVVTNDALRVAPHFPFNLFFLPEIYGLEYTIALARIRSVEPLPGALRRNRVRIAFTTPDAGEETIELALRDRDAFIRAIGSASELKSAPAAV
jgi:hypothetical protein